MSTITVFPSMAEAERLAEQIRQDDVEWTYRPMLWPDGRACIAVFDELGRFVANL